LKKTEQNLLHFATTGKRTLRRLACAEKRVCSFFREVGDSC